MSKCPNYLQGVQLSTNKGCDQKINLGGRSKAGFIASPNISLWTLFKVSHLENCGRPLLSQCTHVTLQPLWQNSKPISSQNLPVCLKQEEDLLKRKLTIWKT